MAIGCVHSRLCGWSYLVNFPIRNLSYTPCNEPSRTVLLLDVHNVRPPPVLTQFTPLGRSILVFLHGFAFLSNDGVWSTFEFRTRFAQLVFPISAKASCIQFLAAEHANSPNFTVKPILNFFKQWSLIFDKKKISLGKAKALAKSNPWKYLRRLMFFAIRNLITLFWNN